MPQHARTHEASCDSPMFTLSDSGASPAGTSASAERNRNIKSGTKTSLFSHVIGGRGRAGVRLLLPLGMWVFLCALFLPTECRGQEQQVKFPQWEGYELLTAHDIPALPGLTCHPQQDGMGSNPDGLSESCCGTPGARACFAGEGTTAFDGHSLLQTNNCTIPDANGPIDLPYLLLNSGNCNLPLAQWDNPNATLPVSRPPGGTNFTFYTASDTHFYRIDFDVPDQAEFPYYLNKFAAGNSLSWNCAATASDKVFPPVPPSCPVLDMGGKIAAPAAIVMPGDIANHGQEYYLGAYRLMWEKNWFPGGIQYPVYPGLGNHDISNINPNVWGNPSPSGAHRMFNYIRWKSHLFHQDRNGTGCLVNIDPGCVDQGLNGGSLNYSWDWEGVHMVMLNTWGGDQNFEYMPAGGMSGLKWLARDLTYYVGNSNRPVILFQHYNLSKIGQDHVEWSTIDYHDFWQVIKNYNVVGIFAGHLHSFDVESAQQYVAAGTILSTDKPALHRNLDMFSDGAVGICGVDYCDQSTGQSNMLAVRVDDHYLDVGAVTYQNGSGFNWDSSIMFQGYYDRETESRSQSYVCRKRINSSYTYMDDSFASVSQDAMGDFHIDVKAAYAQGGAFALELSEASAWDFVDSCDPTYGKAYALVTEIGLSPGDNVLQWGSKSPVHPTAASSPKLVLLNDGVSVSQSKVTLSRHQATVQARSTSGMPMRVTTASDQSWVTARAPASLPGDIIISLNGLPSTEQATITITPDDPYAIPATITVNAPTASPAAIVSPSAISSGSEFNLATKAQ